MAYKPKGRSNKHEILRRQKPYFIIRKISSLVYKLDFLEDSCIYPMIFIVYLSCYQTHDDLFKYIFIFLSPVEYITETNISGDNVRNRKHWELKRIVDHATRRSKTHYLIVKVLR